LRGGELIREARTRAGLTQSELSERTGRERSVIARWEQGLISPPVESLLACLQACGFDLPFVLVPLDKTRDEELTKSLLKTPSERVERMLEDIEPAAPMSKGRKGRVGENRGSGLDPYAILRALQGRDVSFVTIGAFARVIQGTGELTGGVDVTPSLQTENLSRLTRALADLEAERLDGELLEPASLGEGVVELRTSAGELKLVPRPAGSHGYDDLRWQAAREALGRGVRPQVGSPGDLARMLGALDREEELETLLRLRRLIVLDRKLSRPLSSNRDRSVER
jgi:transcriptional regulator with XRE-family HTH domain